MQMCTGMHIYIALESRKNLAKKNCKTSKIRSGLIFDDQKLWNVAKSLRTDMTGMDPFGRKRKFVFLSKI